MNVIYKEGAVTFGDLHFRAAVGSGGVVDASVKKEGDGATPAGTFPLREVLYRSDRLAKPLTDLPTRALQPDDGWCDDPSDPKYNTLVTLPYESSHEELWRDDEIYDVIVPHGYNDDPPVSGKGSAIFMHIARPAYSSTAGCIALHREDLLQLLAAVPAEVFISIEM